MEAGDIIAAPGQIVTRRQLDIASALGLIHPRADYSQGVALFALVLAMVLLLGMYVASFEPKVYANNRQLLLLCMSLVVAAASFRAAEGSSVYAALALGVSSALAMKSRCCWARASRS